jgi:hypothetical protein
MKTNVPETEGLFAWEVREKRTKKLVSVVDTINQFERGWNADYFNYYLVPIKYAGLERTEDNQ